ncbi:superoxide dismutase family protein [Actinoplanes sp. NEAU-A12]|uniref:Superoxide dismutase family protein n=1 Tax=Actinoplanes sandaracinus TaxID=3045177 RepID=A0ABT6WZT9_9ACTN|nr:superoxide dismutase family protein [Actinoplanes sandaracinus]MDI6105271.1 superoxide dismutase family protein [Actinoplanes sandaracinus]
MRYRADLLLTTALLLTPALLTGCAEDIDEPPVVTASSATAAGSPASGAPVTATSTFAPYTANATAVTYDPALVPAGATAAVTFMPAADSTTVQLRVGGLQPGRGYGAHLHVNPCGPTGEAAGPHYQKQADPAASASPPSVDPSYANPRNEVWLDFTTDATGNATTTATQPWTFEPPRAPRSLVIHAQTTKTGPGEAGSAGARAGCVTLPG